MEERLVPDRRSASLWLLARLVTILCFLSLIRRLTRVVNEHTSRAIEEYGSAIAPLLLFTLLWLIADPPPQSNIQYFD